MPVVLCSLGDNSVTEGEVSEAFQFAALKQLPIIYLVQDNNWGISVSAEEARAMDAYEYIDGFKGISKLQVDGADFYCILQHCFCRHRVCAQEQKTCFDTCTSALAWASHQWRAQRILQVETRP